MSIDVAPLARQRPYMGSVPLLDLRCASPVGIVNTDLPMPVARPPHITLKAGRMAECKADRLMQTCP
jgi:hypothetical protein